jgi:hypothetical protein
MHRLEPADRESWPKATLRPEFMLEIEKSCLLDAAFKFDSVGKYGKARGEEAGFRAGAKESYRFAPAQNRWVLIAPSGWTGVEICQTISDGGRRALSGANAFPLYAYTLSLHSGLLHRGSVNVSSLTQSHLGGAYTNRLP